MSQALLVILYLIAAAILAPLICALGFWLRGADSIALPGLGIIATPLLVTVLVIAEFGVIFCAGYGVRYLPTVSMLFALFSLDNENGSAIKPSIRDYASA